MRSSKGFTLVEFILYFALISLVIGAVTAFAIDVVKTRTKTAVVAETDQNMRFGLDRVLRAVRQAAKLNVGASALDVDNGVLSLDMVASSNTPTVFDLSGGALRLKEGTAAAVPLTSPLVTVTKLRFSKDALGNNNVAVTTAISVRWNGTDQDQIYAYTAAASGTAVIRKD